VHTGFWWENRRAGDYLEDPGVDGNHIIKMYLREVCCGHGLDRSGSG
jgi:hypothetical protein